jgi:hypothetical protein
LAYLSEYREELVLLVGSRKNVRFIFDVRNMWTDDVLCRPLSTHMAGPLIAWKRESTGLLASQPLVQ